MNKIKKIVPLLGSFACISFLGCGGTANTPSNSRLLVSNGEADVKNRHLAAVRLTINKSLRCTGVLVGPKAILTASHCFGETRSNETSVREIAGDRIKVEFERIIPVGQPLAGQIQLAAIKAQKALVSPFMLRMICDDPNADPEECYKVRPEMTGHDLAVVLLEQGVETLPFEVEPLAFPTWQEMVESSYEGSPLEVVGFGEIWKNRSRISTYASQRQNVETEFVEQRFRGRGANDLAVDIVVGGGQRIPCHGDSGGPLVMTSWKGDEFRFVNKLMGVASRIESKWGNYLWVCTDATHGVYTSALAAQCWLSNNVPEFQAPVIPLSVKKRNCPDVPFEPWPENPDPVNPPSPQPQPSPSPTAVPSPTVIPTIAPRG